MANEKPTQALALELKKLENRLEELIRVCDTLREENRLLRRQQDQLHTDRAHLVEKNDLARTRVEAMINRLKAMERPT